MFSTKKSQPTTLNNEMEYKITWAILQWLGFPVYLVSIFANIENWKGIVLSLFGVLYIIFMCYDKYETARGKRIDNNEKEWRHKNSHPKKPHNHK